MRKHLPKQGLLVAGLLCLVAGLLLGTFYHGHNAALAFARGLLLGLGMTLLLGRMLMLRRRSRTAC